MIICPKCGSQKWRCWDERTLEWWYPDGSSAGTQVIGMLACNDCNEAWADQNPTNEEMSEGGAAPDSDDDRLVYR